MSDAALLEELKERKTEATNGWQTILDQTKKDRLCVAGKPWDAIDPAGKKERQDAKRPFLALDELGQYVNQAVNQLRANPRGINFAPTGNGANDAGATFYQNHVREIEYRSHASVAYCRAAEDAITSSIGWLRIRTQRAHLRTFDQDLYIDPIMNPDQVLADPNAVWPDSRDIKYLFYLEPWSKKEFLRAFPKAKIKSFGSEVRKMAPDWISGDALTLAEYWTLEQVKRRLVAFRRKIKGQYSEQVETALVHELPGKRIPAGAELARETEVDDPRVCMYLTNGLEILKEQTWPGKYIPFVSCMGKVLYTEENGVSERNILSMTRLARDPYMLYCYIRTCEAEVVGQTPRFPYFAYEGQLSQKWLNALVESVSRPKGVILVKPTVDGAPPGQVLPPPTRNPYDAAAIVGLDAVAEAARRAIQAAFGITPLPTAMQRDNQKSGEAYKQIDSAMQTGSFHFKFNYDLTIERTGVVLEDLMDKVLDTARDVPVRQPNDSAAIVRINDPNATDPIFTKGDYRVTVSEGPSDKSQREEAEAFLDTLVQNIGEVTALVGQQKAAQIMGLSVKMKRLGPIGDEISDLFMPPQPLGKDGKPLPPEVAQLVQQVQQLGQENQQLKQLIQTKQAEKQAELHGKFEIEKYKTDATSSDKDKDREVKLVVAELGAKVDRMALLLEASAKVGVRLDERHHASLDRVHDASESAKDRIHERIEGDKQRAHEHAQRRLAAVDAADAADQAHEHATEQADHGVAGQIAVAQAQPPNETGAGA